MKWDDMIADAVRPHGRRDRLGRQPQLEPQDPEGLDPSAGRLRRGHRELHERRHRRRRDLGRLRSGTRGPRSRASRCRIIGIVAFYDLHLERQVDEHGGLLDARHRQHGWPVGRRVQDRASTRSRTCCTTRRRTSCSARSSSGASGRTSGTAGHVDDYRVQFSFKYNFCTRWEASDERSNEGSWRTRLFAVATVVARRAVRRPSWAQKPAEIEAALKAAYAKYKDLKEGKNADYIPALAKVDSKIFGIALVTVGRQGVHRRRHPVRGLDPVDLQGLHDGQGHRGDRARRRSRTRSASTRPACGSTRSSRSSCPRRRSAGPR